MIKKTKIDQREREARGNTQERRGVKDVIRLAEERNKCEDDLEIGVHFGFEVG